MRRWMPGGPGMFSSWRTCRQYGFRAGFLILGLPDPRPAVALDPAVMGLVERPEPRLPVPVGTADLPADQLRPDIGEHVAVIAIIGILVGVAVGHVLSRP